MLANNSRTKMTIVNTAASLLSRLGMAVFSFALRTVFIYTLGVQYTGVSSVFTDILTVLSLSELGMSSAISTALYKPLRDNDTLKIQKLMHFYKIAYRVIAAFILAVGLLLLPFIDNIIKNVPDIKENIKLIFLFYIIKTSSSYLLIYKTTLLTADQKQYKIRLLEIVCTGIRYAIEIIFLIVMKQFMAYLVIEIVAIILQNYIISRRAVTEYPYAFKKTDARLSKQEMRGLFKDVKGLSMYQLSATVGNSIDNLLVSGMISTATVGLLANYTLIRKQIEHLLKQFYSSVTPSVGNLVAEGNTDKQLVVFNRMFYLSFIVVNFISVSMFVMFNPFISVWLGEEYLFSNSISFIIAFDSFLYILLQAIASFRTANGLFVKGQYRPLFTAIINIFLSVIMIKIYGIFGTILATVISRILTQWYDPYILYKNVFHKPFRRFYLKYLFYILTYFAGCFITYSIAGLIHTELQMLNLVYKAVCCLIIPNALVFLLTFKTEEFRFIINTLTNKIKKAAHRNEAEKTN